MSALFGILARNMAIEDEDKMVGWTHGTQRASSEQIDTALLRVDELLKSGECALIKIACRQASDESKVSLNTLLTSYSKWKKRNNV